MGLAKFALQAGLNPGERWLVVNDVDISRCVRSATLRVDPRSIPELDIEVVGEGAISGEGIVRIQPDEAEMQEMARQAVLDLLDAVDPKQLEADALEGLAMNENATEAILERLKAYVRGA